MVVVWTVENELGEVGVTSGHRDNISELGKRFMVGLLGMSLGTSFVREDAAIMTGRRMERLLLNSLRVIGERLMVSEDTVLMMAVWGYRLFVGLLRMRKERNSATTEQDYGSMDV